MKKYLIVLLVSALFLGCKEQTPTQFTDEALQDVLITLKGDEISFENILKKYEGKKILIDVWASWCGDCIKGMPKVKALQEENKEVVFLFLSADKTLESWKEGIEKYKVKGEHYFMPDGMKSVFSNSINVDWIPRYLIVDPQGNIKLFKAIKADDSKLLDALN
ncbi:TlpA disulfide reductase family protein [Oceanihabitans sediminis]|uniref:TlpA family protein disulfide reductase n=1 Tax=Oceanihabitans sediminis TaxID=1812012 RepID=A0A368P3Z8_9FLAO|nr:TlpA disulfide reductase family protein [Oceanihabitans sediminis]MDX1277837.1 TlpA disulfide reductase family protein [Oceanihabitans sediminis]MDX1774354.1 TlpA disulfide reductase family protein [Oceanihabitans sediminis]RBP29843.1 thiol-disulfide isomerase/thioredoxin [Oceanihabitans sediminis]RCU57183.1 TlpA family protein disulfide reductase [Oceanihabitans sediminis]